MQITIDVAGTFNFVTPTSDLEESLFWGGALHPVAMPEVQD